MGNHVFLLGQLLCCLAQTGLQFEVLLEVIFACLTVQAEHVVELLDIELVVAPQLVSLFCGYVLDLTPLLLKRLELLIALVGFLGRRQCR